MTPVPIVHVLYHGKVLCPDLRLRPLLPSYWPTGHLWVDAGHHADATCPRCLDVIEVWRQSDFVGPPPLGPTPPFQKHARGGRVQVEVGLLEFEEGGNTIWVQSTRGTVLRIKTMGQIRLQSACQNLCAHADITVQDDITICMPEEPKHEPG